MWPTVIHHHDIDTAAPPREGLPWQCQSASAGRRWRWPRSGEMMTDSELAHYREHGYIVRRQAFEPEPLAAQLAAALGDHPRETLQHLLAEVCTEPEPEPEPEPAHKLEDGHDVIPLTRSLAEWLTDTVAVVASRVCGDAALRHSMLSLLGTGSDSGGGSYRQHWHKVRLQSSDRAAMHTFLL
jgi:hypothetical protein